MQTKNEFIVGDCIEVMKRMPLESIDLIVTSPPYNVGIEYDNYNDSKPYQDYLVWCETWLRECYRVLKLGGRMTLNHYISYGTADFRSMPLFDLNAIALKIGFKHKGLAVWEDRHLAKRTAWGSWLSATAPYVNCPFEGIAILGKGEWKREKTGKDTITKKDFIKATRGIWDFHPEMQSEHPAPFPLKLAKICIELFSFEGDMVLDPFTGSGTTNLAAHFTGRNSIGIDISEKYIKMAKDRVEYYSKNKKILDFSEAQHKL